MVLSEPYVPCGYTIILLAGLTFLSSAIPPVGGVIIADYILRRKAYENFEQAKFLNINWTAIVSVIVGVTCGKLLPGIIPVNAVIGWGSYLFGFNTITR